MRRTQLLFRQHIGDMFVKKWKVQGRRIIRETSAIKVLQEKGVDCVDALDVIKERPKLTKPFPVIGYRPKRVMFDSSHPDYLSTPCLTYEDHNVLLEGLEQAKLLTNTVEIEQGVLPPSVEALFDKNTVSLQNELVQRIIKSSLLYDAYQELLPKRKDPERPAWNFPRDYGITDRRRNVLLCNRLLSLCGSCNPVLFPRRRISDDALFRVHLTRCGRDVVLSLRADLAITASKGIAGLIGPEETRSHRLPDIEPLLPTISLEEQCIYSLQDVFPFNDVPAMEVKTKRAPEMTEGAEEKEEEESKVNVGVKGEHVHTIVVHYNESEVGNIFETEVTESQVLGRSLMKCYAVAVAQARQKYGKDVVDLPSPVVVQCVQTDGKMFHFSVFQLNTTEEGVSSASDRVHNAFWSAPTVRLYEVCDFVNGVPLLQGYNGDVFKYLSAFYNNS